MKGEGKRPPAAVPLTALAHNPFNPREELTEIEETAESLRVRGQLQPVAVVRRAAFLVVHPDQETELGAAEYVVIDGNRRLAAASLAGLKELRIDVNDDLAASAADIVESALIANIHRVDVAPIDQANAIQQLVKAHGSQGQVAKRLGKTPAWVSQRLALLGLTEDLQEMVATGELKVESARRIGRMPKEEQAAAAAETVNAVNAPRQRTAKSRRASAGEESVNAVNTPATSGSAAATSSDRGTDTAVLIRSAEEVPVTAPELVSALPWDDPAWFDRLLRKHMASEHRTTLAWLLQADN
jgi:ParB family chromosome partitioning protein